MDPKLANSFTKVIEFEWDPGNIEHIKKHKVTTDDCEQIFIYSETRILKDNKHSISEESFKVFGKTLKQRYLVLVFTIRKNKLRVIMARDQNKKERGELSE